MIVNNVNSSSKYYSSSVGATRYTNATSYVRGVQKSDEFIPSKEAQNFGDLLNKLKNIPDVRDDRVRELEQKISSGQYFVPASDVAESLLKFRF